MIGTCVVVSVVAVGWVVDGLLVVNVVVVRVVEGARVVVVGCGTNSM